MGRSSAPAASTMAQSAPPPRRSVSQTGARYHQSMLKASGRTAILAGPAASAGKAALTTVRETKTQAVITRRVRNQGRDRRVMCSQSAMPIASGSSMCRKNTTKNRSEFSRSSTRNERESGSAKMGRVSSRWPEPRATSCPR